MPGQLGPDYGWRRAFGPDPPPDRDVGEMVNLSRLPVPIRAACSTARRYSSLSGKLSLSPGLRNSFVGVAHSSEEVRIRRQEPMGQSL